MTKNKNNIELTAEDLTAEDIFQFIQRRHKADAVFKEVRIDETGDRRIDAWVILRGRRDYTTIGYEIKIDRHDFLRDNKMHDYYPFCNQIYMVAPSSVCSADELPEGMGFYQVAKSRLLQKKKAVHRQVEIPEGFYKLLLFHRQDDDYSAWSAAERALAARLGMLNDYYDYAEGRLALKALGSDLRVRLAEDQRRLDVAERELAKEQREIEKWKGLEKVLIDRYGYSLALFVQQRKFGPALDILRSESDAREILATIDHLTSALQATRDMIVAEEGDDIVIQDEGDYHSDYSGGDGEGYIADNERYDDDDEENEEMSDLDRGYDYEVEDDYDYEDMLDNYEYDDEDSMIVDEDYEYL